MGVEVLMNTFPFLSILTGIPLVGALMLGIIGKKHPHVIRFFALAATTTALIWTVLLCVLFNPTNGLQFIEKHAWIPSLHIDYFLGADGLSMLMLLLSSLVVTFALFASRPAETCALPYYTLFLLLESGLFGTFTALNFFHWFLFWELSLIPAFFLIKLWGGTMRSPAATQFFVYTMVGSITMLLGFQAIYLSVGTFDLIELGRLGQSGQLTKALETKLSLPGIFSQNISIIVFLAVLLGFAVKVPLIPFHTWLPPAYSEAPNAVTMVLTGVMSKMGVYGFVRILMPLFPQEARIMLIPLILFALATILLSAWAAIHQTDLKKIFAYSSINHLGYCLLGIFAVTQATHNPSAVFEKAAALNGVFMQMFNHGITAAALFYCVEILERRSGGMRSVNHFGGLRTIAPIFTGLMGIALFSSLGLPGLNGFVGEFLIFKGVFALVPWAAIFAAPGLLLTALFLLNMIQKVFMGPVQNGVAGYADLSKSERLLLVPFIVLMFILGIYPQAIVGIFNPTVTQMITRLP